MKKLPKLSEYVNIKSTQYFKILANIILEYTKFIIQPLNISHFVPAKFEKGVWVILKEPILDTNELSSLKTYERKEYQTALDNVVFKGCVLMHGWCLQLSDGFLFDSIEKLKDYTIEDLIPYNLEVNENIIKKFGL